MKVLENARSPFLKENSLYHVQYPVFRGTMQYVQVDVWSYGVVLREMLTQVHPYAPRNTVSIVLELGDMWVYCYLICLLATVYNSHFSMSEVEVFKATLA